jgi:hypothetical protein
LKKILIHLQFRRNTVIFCKKKSKLYILKGIDHLSPLAKGRYAG